MHAGKAQTMQRVPNCTTRDSLKFLEATTTPRTLQSAAKTNRTLRAHPKQMDGSLEKRRHGHTPRSQTKASIGAIQTTAFGADVTSSCRKAPRLISHLLPDHIALYS